MRRGGKEKSEPLIPSGTLDSSAVDADEVEMLNKKWKINVKPTITANNASVAPSPPPPLQVQQPQQTSAAPTASTRPNSGQKQESASGLNSRQRAQLELQQATDDEEESYVYEPKKGHKMFFFICDTKRAVIILTSFDFCIVAFSMTRLWRLAKENGESFDMSNDFSKKFVTQACALFVDVAVVVGALWYSALVVSVGFLFKCYQLATSSISALQNWQNDTDFITSVAIVASLNVLFLYASAAFMWEVHSGILTQKTYQRREKYSCCCEC